MISAGTGARHLSALEREEVRARKKARGWAVSVHGLRRVLVIPYMHACMGTETNEGRADRLRQEPSEEEEEEKEIGEETETGWHTHAHTRAHICRG